MARMHIDLAKYPHERINTSKPLAEEVQRAILLQPVKPALVFLEGIDLQGDASDGKSVAGQLRLMQQVAEHHHIALVGTTGAPKFKPNEGYVGLRDRVIGSGNWARMSETIIVLQKEHHKETDVHTLMYVLGRNDAIEQFTLEWENGKYRALTSDELEKEKNLSETDEILSWMSVKGKFKKQDLRNKFKLNGKQIKRKLEEFMQKGILHYWKSEDMYELVEV
jgi:hypothetical protein